MVNFTTARREPAALSSGWNSVSLAITFTPTILAERRAAEPAWLLQRHGGKRRPGMHGPACTARRRRARRQTS